MEYWEIMGQSIRKTLDFEKIVGIDKNKGGFIKDEDGTIRMFSRPLMDLKEDCESVRMEEDEAPKYVLGEKITKQER